MRKPGKHSKIIKTFNTLSRKDYVAKVYGNKTITGIYRDLGWKKKVSGEMCDAVRTRSAKEGPDLNALGYPKDHSSSYDIAHAMSETGKDKNFFYRATDTGELPYFMKRRSSDGRMVRHVYKSDVRRLIKEEKAQEKKDKTTKPKKVAKKTYKNVRPKLPVPPDPFNPSEETLSSKEGRLISEIGVIDREIGSLNKKKTNLLNDLEMVRKVKNI